MLIISVASYFVVELLPILASFKASSLVLRTYLPGTEDNIRIASTSLT